MHGLLHIQPKGSNKSPDLAKLFILYIYIYIYVAVLECKNFLKGFLKKKKKQKTKKTKHLLT